MLIRLSRGGQKRPQLLSYRSGVPPLPIGLSGSALLSIGRALCCADYRSVLALLPIGIWGIPSALQYVRCVLTEADGVRTECARSAHGVRTGVGRLGTSLCDSSKNWRRPDLYWLPITTDLADSFKNSTESEPPTRGEVVRGITLKK